MFNTYYLRRIYLHTFLYLSPVALSYWWIFGSLAIFFLLVQISSGILLATWYIPTPYDAFDSVEYIMREVEYGWLLRYTHSNGASFFFCIIFLHVFRTVIFNSHVEKLLTWFSGVIIFGVLMLIAFLGYVLPWGQMSFWAATVITSLVSVLPFFGNDLLLYIWGGYGVGTQTLTRFYTFHFLLPFFLAVLAIVHITVLHIEGSSDVLGTLENTDTVTFYPFFTSKDLVGINVCLLFFSCIIFFYPNLLSHPINYMQASTFVTPVHIVPEWYFLPFYGILRSVPSKSGGVITLINSLTVFVFLPFNYMTEEDDLIPNARFRPRSIIELSVIVSVLLIIGWLGGLPLEEPFSMLTETHVSMISMIPQMTAYNHHIEHSLLFDVPIMLSQIQQADSRSRIDPDLMFFKEE